MGSLHRSQISKEFVIKADLELMRDSLQRMQASSSPFAEAPFLPPERHEWN